MCTAILGPVLGTWKKYRTEQDSASLPLGQSHSGGFLWAPGDWGPTQLPNSLYAFLHPENLSGENSQEGQEEDFPKAPK